MAIIDDLAEIDPNIPLLEMFPFIEMDLALVIEAYEKGSREKQTEESVTASAFSELQKMREHLSFSSDVMNVYSGVNVEADVEVPPYIAACFPCDDRLILQSDNLPMPDFLSIFDSVMDVVEALIKRFEALLDSTEFYLDACMVIDSMRTVCPQDILLMVNMLTFQILDRVRQSFKLDIDLMSLLGVIMLPIFMFMFAITDSIGQMSVGPANCFIGYLEEFNRLAAEQSELAYNASNRIVNESGFSAEANVHMGDSGLAGNLVGTGMSIDARPEGSDMEVHERRLDEKGRRETNEKGISGTNDTTVQSSVNRAVGQADTPIYNATEEIKQNSAFSYEAGAMNLLHGKIDVSRNKISEFINLFRGSSQSVIKMLSELVTDKMDLILDIIETIRTVALLSAIAEAASDGSICTDPNQPLTPDDVATIIDLIDPDLTPDNGDGDGGSTEITIESGVLTIKDNILNKQINVPKCMGYRTEGMQKELDRWLLELRGR